MTLEELEVLITAQTSDFKKELEQVKKSVNRLGNNVSKSTSGIKSLFSNMLKGIVALKIGQKIAQSITEGFKDALKVEASLQQIQRQMGESSNAFLKWAKTQAIGFGMSTSEAIRYGSIYGNLLSAFTKDSTETFNKTQDLLKASAVIASSTGRTMEDTMERIRSGLLGSTEAIEDLGVNVNVAMLESTNAFRQFANGQSWNQLSFQTQQQIRLMAILEQTSQKYGDTLANNTSTKIAILTAHLNNAKLALGQAFLAIANVVLPLLTSLAAALSQITSLIAQFTTALFGSATVSKNVATSTGAVSTSVGNLGDNASKAGKEAKKLKSILAGFDEINTLQTSAGDTSAGESSSGGGVSTPSIGGIDTTGLVPSVDTAMIQVTGRVQAMADTVKRVLSSIFKPIKDSWSKYGPNVLEQVDLAKQNTIATFNNLKDTLVSIWNNGGSEIVRSLSDIVLNIITIGGRIYNEFILPIANWFIDFLDPEANRGMQGVMDGVNWLLEKIKELTDYLAGDGFKYVEDFLALFTGWKAATFVIEVAKSTKAIVANTVAALANTAAKIKDKIETGILIGLYAKDTAAKVLNTAKTWLQETATAAATVAQKALNIAMNMNPISKVIVVVTALISAIVLLYNKCDWFRNGVNGILNKIIDALNGMIRGINKLHFDVPKWVPIIGGKEWGFNIPTIPKLAQGGYVGANSPILAMIGDNRREGEIVAPESKIYEQTLKAVLDGMKATGGKNLELTINLGSKRLIHQIVKDINDLQNQTGKPVFNF